jgi:hypothetical protein
MEQLMARICKKVRPLDRSRRDGERECDFYRQFWLFGNLFSERKMVGA